MQLECFSVPYAAVEQMRLLYREEAHCQIVHDSILRRELANAFLFHADGAPAGYGGVWHKHYPGRIMEFYTLPSMRTAAADMFELFISTSGAVEMEAQSNMPRMLDMLLAFCDNIQSDIILYHDAVNTHISRPDCSLVKQSEWSGEIFAHQHEPVGEWLLIAEGKAAATGGALHHYNPPYADIYMETDEHLRCRGYASFLIQELKRKCYEIGKIPSARSDASNKASRLAMQKAGMLPCGRLAHGTLRTR